MSEQKKFLSKLTPDDVGGEKRCVLFVLGNGVKVRACLDDYNAETVEKLALHGLSQKIGDSAANCAKERDFHAAFGKMQSVEDNLRQGVWSDRSGGGTADLVQALAKLQGLTLEEVQTAVDAMDEDQLKTVRGNLTVKAEIAKIVAKRAGEAAKAAAPLDALMKTIGLGKK